MPGAPGPDSRLLSTVLLVVGNVERDEWRALGTSIALQRLDAELLDESRTRLIVEFATTDGDIPQMRQVGCFTPSSIDSIIAGLAAISVI